MADTLWVTPSLLISTSETPKCKPFALVLNSIGSRFKSICQSDRVSTTWIPYLQTQEWRKFWNNIQYRSQESPVRPSLSQELLLSGYKAPQRKFIRCPFKSQPARLQLVSPYIYIIDDLASGSTAKLTWQPIRGLKLHGIDWSCR